VVRTLYSALLVATTVLAWGCEGGCGCSPGRVSEAPNADAPDEAVRTPRRKKALPSIGLKGERVDAPEPTPIPTPPEPAIDGGTPPAQRDGGVAAAPNLDGSVRGRPAPAPEPVPILPPSFLDAGAGGTPDLNPTPFVPIPVAPPAVFLDGGAGNFAPPALAIYLDAGAPAPAPAAAGSDSGVGFRFDMGFKDAQANPSPVYYDGGARFVPTSYFDASR
jgi:hypothetical protein